MGIILAQIKVTLAKTVQKKTSLTVLRIFKPSIIYNLDVVLSWSGKSVSCIIWELTLPPIQVCEHTRSGSRSRISHGNGFKNKGPGNRGVGMILYMVGPKS